MDLYTGKLVLLDDGRLGPASIVVSVDEGKIVEVKKGTTQEQGLDLSRYRQVRTSNTRLQ